MKLTREQFKDLQKEWYDRLEETGFKDAEKETENKEVVLAYRGAYILRNMPSETARSAKEEYYVQISKKVQSKDTKYNNLTDKYILLKHSEGSRIKEIVEDLALLGINRGRQTIGRTIQKYVLLWKIERKRKPRQ